MEKKVEDTNSTGIRHRGDVEENKHNGGGCDQCSRHTDVL